eukprot:CAMPEP_0172802726 /NCGR_PEP_ID=MMETSP1075-20121228/4059_1 /TAXON_ID=2916 /ORGANISM="Ceratium fusus, Strain PA161109" /LENGTH=77 /DNA_ID=CAMNT_0013641039 /DNA_START=57 /DNA_END=290 /DNA_ORIENTATION=+
MCQLPPLARAGLHASGATAILKAGISNMVSMRVSPYLFCRASDLKPSNFGCEADGFAASAPGPYSLVQSDVCDCMLV